MGRYKLSVVSGPEFINLEPSDISPTISKCQIKVMYVGENRNNTFFKKEVVENMAKTLRGCPIVGYYSKEKKDFTDHGEQITFGPEGFNFEVLTKPYGFVAPDAKVWFQKFSYKDDFDKEIEKEYLVTEGYLWTEQYEEAKQMLENGGASHSMEISENTKGFWSENDNENYFFIITDSMYTKLCILGDETEPCYQGSEIIPETSYSYNNNDFRKTLYSMMKELKPIMNKNNVNNTNTNDNTATTDSSTINTEYESLKINYETLEKEKEELLQFKLKVQAKEKDELIAKFSMISDKNEIKKDIINNKDKYSLDEIESKLSVYCFRNKINFSTESNSEEQEPAANNIPENKPSFTYSMNNINNSETNPEVPDWIRACYNLKKNK